MGMLLLVCPAFGQFQDQNSSYLTSKQPIDKNWFEQAQKIITDAEYEFKKAHHSSFDFYAVNKKQKIGFAFTKAGYSVSPVQFGENSKDWKVNFELLKLRRNGNRSLAMDDYVISQDKANLRYQYPGFAIEYINSDAGLRQNFIVNEKIDGNRELEVLLQLGGDLAASVSNNELILKDDQNKNQLFYRDLKVWDAGHRVLNARMELRDKNVLAIVVEDKDAQYPITIDPLNQTPDWATSADGILPALIGQLAVEAAYGFSVAGLGDINGDGFDDVAVGAPTMVDVITGGNLVAVGAVFIYRGSANGLPTTPSAVLRPTNRIAGALFGYSIAGGDINGDGKNDVLVGAPMDSIVIATGGSSTASGRVGKAYVFNGANLTTSSTPFITIRLSTSSIISPVNISVNALFGFSVAVTEDLNADGKKDIIVGSPTYAGIKTVIVPVLDVQSGGAFVYLTKATDNTLKQVKLEPIKQSLLGLGLLSSNIAGLLFGYAVDGTGDYNGDGKADVVATSPAGINAGSISGLLNGKVLQGSAQVHYGSGNGPNATVNAEAGAVLTATSGGLLTNLVGSIANVANLFGVSVKGVRDPSCARNGNILVGAPLGGAIINVLGLDLKTGTVNVFKKKSSSPSGYVAPDQVLASPRNSNNILQLIQANLLFGYSLDNICDINCDGFADIIVGEPVSSGVQLINANIAGGAAYVYYGNASGLYQTSPAWTLTAYEDEFLAINTTSLIGYSVAGAGRSKGAPYNYNILVGSPSRTLDFGNGLLNLGSTLETLFSLVAGNNGVGKAYAFDIKTCDHQPVAVNDVIATNEDTPVNGNAATNDSPSLDGGNTWSLVGTNGGAQHGTVVMNPDGTYTYSPEPNYHGTDQFTYQLCDVDNDCSTATVTVTINSVDDMPIAVNDQVTTNEDTPVNGNAASNDTPSGDGGNIWTLVGTNGGAANGTVTMNANGTFTYTPNANYNGSDVFTYKLCDADNDCSTATVTVTIAPVDDVPVAVNDNVTTNEDTPVTTSAATNDTPSGDGGNIWTLVGTNGGAAHGSVSMNSNGTFTYTPAANYNGSDVFTYKLCDADNDCSTATVTVTITPVDDVPDAVNDQATTNEDTPVSGNAASNDTPSGDCANTWSLVGTNGGAQHGVVVMNANGTYTYTPVPNYNGSDVFTYKLCDCEDDCDQATVTITINAVNDVPLAVNDLNTTNEDTPVSGNSASNDTPSGDGGNVWSLVGTNGGAQHGTVTMNPNGTYTYTPAPNYHGSDVFTYKLCDVNNDCSQATVTITINSVDDIPVAVNDQITTNEDTPKSGNAASNDTPSGDCANTWALVGVNGGALHGTVVMNSNGTFTYTPHDNYTGPDSFTYRLCDCEDDCSQATVSVTVNPVNDIPVAVNDQITTNEDTPKSGNAASNDTPSGDCANTWSLVGTNGGALHGTVVMNSNGTFTYTPQANYNGTDAFIYKLCDCENDCSQATVNVTINPVNDLPVAVNDQITTNEDAPKSGNAATNDTPSGDCANTWSLVGTNGGALHGSVTMNADGTFTYTPHANYHGTDAFTYKLCDCENDCSQAIVNVTINSVNDLPVAVNDVNSTTENTPVGGNAASNDTPSGDGGNVWSLVGTNGGALHGTVTMNPNGTYNYTPAPGYSGSDVFTYKLCDVNNDCSQATVTITISSACSSDQTPPSVTCPQNKTVALSGSCTATLPDYRNEATKSDNCTPASDIAITQTPAGGTTLSGVGTTTVVIKVTDASGNTATCSFTVTRVDQTAPVLICQSARTVDCNTTPAFDAPAASDNCGQPSVAIVSTTMTPSGTSTVHTRTWRATDGSGNTATCSQSITQTSCTGPLGHIYPTSTSCNTYLNGAQPLAQLCYSFRNNKVSNITPGVFFYFATITAPSSSFTIDVVQTKSCASFSFFAIQQGNQINLFSSGCTTFAGGQQTTTGQGRINVTNATPGAQYVISVKYDSKSVQGSAFTGSAPVCQYNFETRINGAVAGGTQGSINLVPNCSSGTTTKQSEAQYEQSARPEAQIGLYPNPASDHVNIVFTPAHTAKSSIEMYDVTGKLVASIYNGEIEQGKPYQRKIDTRSLSAGVYLIRFRNGEFIETKKLVITK